MSEVTKTALYSVLSGDATLVALLAEDENDDPGIYNASLNKIADPQFPCITFREGDGSADGRFRSLTMDSENFDLEIWVKPETSVSVSDIHSEVDRLLHNQVLTLDDGTNYDCVRISQNPDNYDPQLKLNFGLYRYRLVVSR